VGVIDQPNSGWSTSPYDDGQAVKGPRRRSLPATAAPVSLQTVGPGCADDFAALSPEPMCGNDAKKEIKDPKEHGRTSRRSFPTPTRRQDVMPRNSHAWTPGILFLNISVMGGMDDAVLELRPAQGIS
jgi:hypothetical protein